MTIRNLIVFAGAIALSSCSSPRTAEETSAAVAGDWNLGVALWTFHTFNMPDALDKVDSSGLKYIEPNTFHSAGPELGDSTLTQLSPTGIDKVKEMITSRGLVVESIYIGGDSTFASWKKQFDVAKRLGVKFVTAEPPPALWDRIDSLAGAYGLKVALHEHWKEVSYYWHPDSVLKAIEGHPNFGACADLGHWPKSGVNPVEGVQKLRGHIIGIHLKDIAAFNDPKLRDVPVGTGVVDFPGVFRELKEHSFNGNIYIERDAEDLPSNLPSVMQTIRYYNDEVSKLQK